MLDRLVVLYLPKKLMWDVELVLAPGEAPPLVLGGGEARLGWNTWLSSEKIAEEVSVRFPGAE